MDVQFVENQSKCDYSNYPSSDTINVFEATCERIKVARSTKLKRTSLCSSF